VRRQSQLVSLEEKGKRTPRQEQRPEDSLEEGLGTGAVLESDRVSDLISERNVHLISDTLGDRHGGDSTRLGASNLQSRPPKVRQVGVGDVLRNSVHA
jgi:hypothetical protein